MTRHFFSDGLYAKQMYLKRGFKALTHRHKYDHLSILAQGDCIIGIDGVKTRYTAPCCINIAKNIYHEIEALENSTFYCIHATDETDPEKVDKVLIMGEG